MTQGEILKALRRKNKKTQPQMAAELNITKAVITNWERNITRIDSKAIDMLAAYFKVSANVLLGIEELPTTAEEAFEEYAKLYFSSPEKTTETKLAMIQSLMSIYTDSIKKPR